MGTTGYRRAAYVTYRSNEVILEIGSGQSTDVLAAIGPLVITIDVERSTHDRWLETSNVETWTGSAEELLNGWNRPIGFAWLDGHDWPYDGVPAGFWDDQRASYDERDQPYSQDASRASHLAIVKLIGDHARVIAFDDTWQTHDYRAINDGDGDDGSCDETVPPATPPASLPALNQPTGTSTCQLPADHPHHDDPERGWNGKGGTAIPYLLDRGFRVIESELGLVALKRGEL